MTPDCIFGLIATALALLILAAVCAFFFYGCRWWDEYLDSLESEEKSQ